MCVQSVGVLYIGVCIIGMRSLDMHCVDVHILGVPGVGHVQKTCHFYSSKILMFDAHESFYAEKKLEPD
jgi:hypothetical protein